MCVALSTIDGLTKGRSEGRKSMLVLLIAFLAAGLTACTTAESASEAQTVKITPLGSHAGEFCTFDRAMIFEDPDGTRLLYDVGRTVSGAEDARLRSIVAVLLSHGSSDERRGGEACVSPWLSLWAHTHE